MNFGDLEVHSVHQKRPHLQRILTSERPITPLNVRLEADRSPSFSSSESETTVIRWKAPRSSPRTPELTPERTPNLSAEQSPDSLETVRPRDHQNLSSANEAAYVSNEHFFVRFEEGQLQRVAAQPSKTGRMMNELDSESNPPTPTDDTPYIRFALDQLTRDEDLRAIQRSSSNATHDSYPVNRITPYDGIEHYMTPEREREALALVRKHRASPRTSPRESLFKFNPTRPLSYNSHSSEVNTPSRPYQYANASVSEVLIPVDLPPNVRRYSKLTYLPPILRPTSMIMLSIICLLMIAALMFCAIWSAYHNGLFSWYGGIYGARYFLFSFLPQILAACIFIYVQCVMSAITRIMPFTLMAMGDVKNRSNTVFMDLFPRTMLYPRWDGLMSIDIAKSFFWLSVFTIPLQSCLFSVVLVDGVWMWTTVQGIAWTLIAVYILILLATIIMMVFLFRRKTGLLWDPRSLADLVALLPQSNSLRDYPGTEIMGNREAIRHKLALRSDRLGYWRTQNRALGVFHCIGADGPLTRQFTLEGGRLQERTSGGTLGFDDMSDIEKNGELYSVNTRFRYIPWFLRDGFVIFWSVAGFFTLLALFVVSFLPSTAIKNGFPPIVAVVAASGGYSTANFMYSFIPSTIGMLLYLFYQPLDMAVRRLQPWAELSQPEGATARRSLLLDYPASLPISCTIKALSARHYRVAMTSLLSFLFIVIPILAGGLFFPLTTPEREVRMIPNLPAFYIILALLILYLLGLFILIPNRRSLSFPHDTSCLAEIFSFVYNSGMLDDASFRSPKSKADLKTKLMAVKARGQVNSYAFGVYTGRDGKETLGVERLGRKESGEIMVLRGRSEKKIFSGV